MSVQEVNYQLGLKSANLHLYTEERYKNAPNTNQVIVAQPGKSNRFGDILVCDWPLLDGSGEIAQVVGRVQGQATKAEREADFWDMNVVISFRDNQQYNGSTLVARGILKYDVPFEWAVVGGTGQLTLAQGIIRGKGIRSDGDSCLNELFIHVFYRPLQEPTSIINVPI